MSMINSEPKKILILLTTPTKEHLKEIIYYIFKKNFIESNYKPDIGDTQMSKSPGSYQIAHRLGWGRLGNQTKTKITIE